MFTSRVTRHSSSNRRMIRACQNADSLERRALATEIRGCVSVHEICTPTGGVIRALALTATDEPLKETMVLVHGTGSFALSMLRALQPPLLIGHG